MNGLFAAATEIQEFIETAGWPFCFIGGLAVQRWGEPRLTRDVDLTLLVDFGAEDDVIGPLLDRFASRIEDAGQFARTNRVLLLRSSGGVPLDIALGALDFEVRAVDRASGWIVPGCPPLRTCSAEDLVVFKAFAGRDRDWADIAGVVARHGSILAQAEVRAELAPLLELKGAPEAMDRLQSLFDQSGLP